MLVRTQRNRLATLSVALVSAALFIAGSSFGAPRAALVTTLANGWKLTPAGSVLPLGTLPLGLAEDPSGRWLAITNAGFGDLSVDIVSEETGKIVDSQPLARTFFGVAFAPSGDALYVSTAADGGIARFAFNPGSGKLGNLDYFALGGGRLWTNGIAASPDGTTVYAAVAGAEDLVAVNASSGATTLAVRVGTTPYAIQPTRDGRYVYVSNWGGASLSVVEPATSAVVATIATDDHPGALLLGPDGRTLYVACANGDVVDVIDTLTNRRRGKIDVALYPHSPQGATPSALATTPDGHTLFVADADANAVVAIDVASSAPAVFGAVPVGWYPTAVLLSRDAKRLYVLDGRGQSGHANPGLETDKKQYAPNLATGDLETVTSFDRSSLLSGLGIARANSPYRPDLAAPALPPFKHVIYVIKENRTYDQVLGDDPRGNGMPALAKFGQKVSPNTRRLADEFVLLDDFECEGLVSADGHQWTDGAYATDWVQRMWPSDYAGRADGFYDFGGAINRPSGDYLWELAVKHGVSVRIYGEAAASESNPAKGLYPSVDPLLDTAYRPFDLSYMDQDRVVEWLREFRQFEANANLPQIEIVALPDDHTAALKPGMRTPQAMVADNDYAIGRMIEALSHSRYWRDTLFVSVEDDAQNGPDHVSDQRSIALVVSAYVNRGLVDHTRYTSSSVLRTIEAIFGLPPMSQYDASATPFSTMFTTTPDMRPWRASLPQVDLRATNPAGGAGAQASERLDLRSADASDPIEFNRILDTYVK